MACLLCNGFQGKGPLPTEEEYFEGNAITRHIKQDGIAWSSFVVSAATCYCCDTLRKGVAGCLSQHGMEPDFVESIDIEFYYPSREGADEDSNKTITCRLIDAEGAKTEFQVEFFTLDEPDCPCPEAWEYVPISARTSAGTRSEEAFEKACEWLRDCDDEYHGQYEDMCDENSDGDDEPEVSYCAAARLESSSSPRLPSRLVDVGRHTGKVRVVETARLPIDKYISLSHCWGLQQIITTKTATLAERMREINVEELSKTFWDAICMTKKFGIDYIWIDSLCIIQDDSLDWQRESAQMASIYRHAYLTIAATKASSGAGGLFTETPDFEVRGTTPAGEDYLLVFREKIQHELSVDLTTDRHFPLMARGWIYQERMLSPRVLHFGHHELFFECATSCRCECGDIGFLGNYEDVPLPNPRQMYSSALESIAKTTKGGGGEWSNEQWLQQSRYYVARIWRSMVVFYTGLRLTFPGDRLPAVGGVARTFAGKRRSPYLAGLFEDSILDDLLWDVCAGKRGRPNKPDEYIAPSRSWASVAEPVTYRDGLVYWDEEIYQEKQEERIEFAKVESCEAVRAGIDEFGQVQAGRLCIKGPLLRATVSLTPGLDAGGRHRYHLQFRCGIDEDGAVTVAPRVWPDYDWTQGGSLCVSPGDSVYCLRMVQYLDDKTDMLLMLRRVQGIGKDNEKCIYERVGSLRLLTGTSKVDGLEAAERDMLVAALDHAPVQSLEML
ncbi:hypothetical protein PG985_011077 [Apiospora marii]|uniref:Heterokaryon incompatibility domain-containing protein n=1 Tax=Apiospora marii TaxID=335849 RepID=A0ABR1SSQ3_9PEZI